MEILVPFMPMFATLPFAAAAAWAVHRILRHRERTLGASADIQAMRDEIETMRETQMELQERLDVTERVLAQVRASQRHLPEGN